MKLKILLVSIVAVFSQFSNAVPIDLSGKGYVTYGDFNSYSLPISGIKVASSPGQISDLIVVATGSSGNPINTNFAGMDDAYSTPKGQNGSNFFSTGTSADPGQVSGFTNDQTTTWDTSLASLQTFLSGEDMIFFFNNNNLNGGNLQSLAAWAQIQVKDANNMDLGTFDFTNNRGAYNLVSEGGGGIFMGDPVNYLSITSAPHIGDNSDTDYVLAGGPICIDTDTSPPTPVSCSNPLADEGPINHNLGADEAAYAIVAPELNTLLAGLFSNVQDLSGYTMSIDLRLGCDPGFGVQNDEICTGAVSGFGKNVNNGFEQLFIGTAISVPSTLIPEPHILLLLGSGLVYLRFRRQPR